MHDSSKRDTDPASDEGVLIEPTGRRVERKDRKNKREQERRKEINDRFALLSDLLFGSKFSGRVDKTQILDRAIDLVRNGPSVLRNPENLGPPPEPREENASPPPRETWPQGEFSNANGEKAIQPLHGGRYHENCRGSHCSHELLPVDSREMGGHQKYQQTSYQSYPNFPQQNGHSSMAFNSNYFFPPQYNTNYSPAILSEQSRFNSGRSGRCMDCDNDPSPERHALHHNAHSSQLPPHPPHQHPRRNSNGNNHGNNHAVANGPVATNGWAGSHVRKDFQRLVNESSGDSAELSDLADAVNGDNRRRASSTLLLTTDSINVKDCDPLAKVQVALLDTLVQLSQNPKRMKR